VAVGMPYNNTSPVEVAKTETPVDITVVQWFSRPC
jgi:hypothetical protein